MPTLVREIVLKYRMRQINPAEAPAGYLSKLSKPEDAVMFLKDIADDGVERFVCLYLNSKNKILVKQVIESGTVNQANPILREIFRYGISCDASSVIVGH